MSNNLYSLRPNTKCEEPLSLEKLKNLHSQLLKNFEYFSKSLDPHQTEIKDLQTTYLTVFSKCVQIYELEKQKNATIIEDFQCIQKEAAKEWNLRQLELVNQVKNLEKRIEQLENNSKNLMKENLEILESLTNSARIVSESFEEILEVLKGENLQFESNFKIEKIVYESLNHFQKSTGSHKKNTQSSDYYKVVHLADYKHKKIPEERHSLSSLSNFLEDTYKKNSTIEDWNQEKKFIGSDSERDSSVSKNCAVEDKKSFDIVKLQFCKENSEHKEKEQKQLFSNENILIERLNCSRIGNNNSKVQVHEEKENIDKALHKRYESGDTFRTSSDWQLGENDSFRTFREGASENTIVEIFPPIIAENPELLISNASLFKKYRYRQSSEDHL